ncbi:phosphatase PAP2 family protein [Halopelagius longus]|uniref:Phosphatase PAP2 family protein n=1 Tax=Halopelagius longus TaxID=1236180 RepID=A0A370ISH0_9EURY|nr:phosphatase PAP2 family protein [Halopelagius longus]
MTIPARTAPGASLPVGGLPAAARGIGELAAARSLPEFVVSAFGLVTHLGDAWLCLAAVTFAYVAGERSGLPRRSAAFALALGLGALGLTLGLKHLFALPRPPLAAEEGFGFPSGHALGATVFWGGIALLVRVGTRRRRLSVAGAVILLVAASRVVLGVHYVADVAAGVAVGVAFLAAMSRLSDRGESPAAPVLDPTRAQVTAAFAAAFVLVAAALVVAPSESELLLGVGTAAGAAATWHYLGHRANAAELDRSAASAAVGGVGLPVLLGAMVVVAELSTVAVLVVAAGAVGGAGLLALPFAASSIRRR